MTTSLSSVCGVGEACEKHVSLKYELIYLMAFEDGIHLNKEVQRCFHWYNQERPHQALKYRTPESLLANAFTECL